MDISQGTFTRVDSACLAYIPVFAAWPLQKEPQDRDKCLAEDFLGAPCILLAFLTFVPHP